MRKIILLISLIFSAGYGSAQLLNPDFESVTSGKPNDWNLGFYSTYFIKDTNDAHNSIHAAHIRAFGAQSYSVQGAVLGLFSFTAQPTRPAALQGWYKCNLQPGDSLVFSPYVYQSTVSSPAVQAYSFTTSSSTIFKQFTAPFNYGAFPTNTIGTLFVSIYLSGPTQDAENYFIPQAGTWAIIDDLIMAYPIAVGVAENEISSGIEKIYPKPSAGTSFVVYNLQSESVCSMKLFDITGKEAMTVFEGEHQSPGRYKAVADLSNLSPGVYFVKLSAGEATYVSKLVKE